MGRNIRSSVAAGNEAVMIGDTIPEETRRKALARFPGVNVRVRARRAFLEPGVAVFARQNVFVPRQRIDEGVMLEIIGSFQPPFVTRVRVKIDHDFVHPAEFGLSIRWICARESGENSSAHAANFVSTSSAVLFPARR